MDIEYPHKLTEEERKALLKAFESAKPKPCVVFKIPLVFGTQGSEEITDKNVYRQLWTEENF